MKEIQVDEDGNLRCATCGGKNLQGRRTTRAHVIGFVTLGAGALLTQRKLRCQQCGAYNYQGGMGTKAQTWNDDRTAGVGGGGGKILSEGVRYVRVAESGDFRCWYCGYVLTADTPGEYSCERCGHLNEMSTTRPWNGPVSDGVGVRDLFGKPSRKKWK